MLYYYYDLILNFFLCILGSTADAAAVNPKGIKKLLTKGLITFFINGNPVFSNGLRNLLRHPHYCIIFDNWVFDNLVLVDELFVKDLQRLEILALVIITHEEN